MGWKKGTFGLSEVGRGEERRGEEEAGGEAGERKWDLMNRGRQGASMRK